MPAKLFGGLGSILRGKAKGQQIDLEMGMKQGRQSGCKRKAWHSRSKGNRLQSRSEADFPSEEELNNIPGEKKSLFLTIQGKI